MIQIPIIFNFSSQLMFFFCFISIEYSVLFVSGNSLIPNTPEIVHFARVNFHQSIRTIFVYFYYFFFKSSIEPGLCLY